MQLRPHRLVAQRQSALAESSEHIAGPKLVDIEPFGGAGLDMLLLILLAAAATDWADGYFARRRLQVTTLGILLDPIADKLLISAAFIALVDMHLVPAWMVVIIIGREFTVLGLRNIASAEGFTIAASALGKTKMVLQVCAVAVLIAGATHASLKPLALVLLWLVVASALISAAQYFFRFWNQLDSRITQRRKLRMMEARAKSEDVVPS